MNDFKQAGGRSIDNFVWAPEDNRKYSKESLALARKFMSSAGNDATSSELYFYPEELGLDKDFYGKVVVVTVKLEDERLN